MPSEVARSAVARMPPRVRARRGVAPAAQAFGIFLLRSDMVAASSKLLAKKKTAAPSTYTLTKAGASVSAGWQERSMPPPTSSRHIITLMIVRSRLCALTAANASVQTCEAGRTSAQITQRKTPTCCSAHPNSSNATIGTDVSQASAKSLSIR